MMIKEMSQELADYCYDMFMDVSSKVIYIAMASSIITILFGYTKITLFITSTMVFLGLILSALMFIGCILMILVDGIRNVLTQTLFGLGICYLFISLAFYLIHIL